MLQCLQTAAGASLPGQTWRHRRRPDRRGTRDICDTPQHRRPPPQAPGGWRLDGIVSCIHGISKTLSSLSNIDPTHRSLLKFSHTMHFTLSPVCCLPSHINCPSLAHTEHNTGVGGREASLASVQHCNCCRRDNEVVTRTRVKTSSCTGAGL